LPFSEPKLFKKRGLGGRAGPGKTLGREFKSPETRGRTWPIGSQPVSPNWRGKGGPARPAGEGWGKQQTAILP